MRRWPDLEVYVHERGARHLVDPSRLLASAERLYGDAMERLWGEIVPVPEANVRPLAGGETVLGMRVAYTPGHASHHVCYLHEESGTAFVGDVAAVRIPGGDLIVPPTPPPDIDIETWIESIGLVEVLAPERLALTHFGADRRAPAHLAGCASACARRPSWRASSPRTNTSTATATGSPKRPTRGHGRELLQCVPPEYQWRGLDRYWRKRAEREAAAYQAVSAAARRISSDISPITASIPSTVGTSIHCPGSRLRAAPNESLDLLQQLARCVV